MKTTKEVRIQYRCLRCKKRDSALVLCERTRLPTRIAIRFVNEIGHSIDVSRDCGACGWQCGWTVVTGRTNPDRKCDARCTNATGHNCECACGGKNHGAGHGA
jgi:hypothetical protein